MLHINVLLVVLQQLHDAQRISLAHIPGQLHLARISPREHLRFCGRRRRRRCWCLCCWCARRVRNRQRCWSLCLQRFAGRRGSAIFCGRLLFCRGRRRRRRRTCGRAQAKVPRHKFRYRRGCYKRRARLGRAGFRPVRGARLRAFVCVCLSRTTLSRRSLHQRMHPAPTLPRARKLAHRDSPGPRPRTMTYRTARTPTLRG